VRTGAQRQDLSENPEELDRVVKAELRKWAEVIRDATIKVD